MYLMPFDNFVENTLFAKYNNKSIYTESTKWEEESRTNEFRKNMFIRVSNNG